MMFYNYHPLENDYINKTFNIEKISKLIENNKKIPEKISKLSFYTDFAHNISTITIILKGMVGMGPYTMARIKITTTPANCGSLFIHELFPKYRRQGVATYLLKEVENWAVNSGYTMIHCNIPIYPNIEDTHYKFFEKNGYKLMMEPYVNIRSGNLNKWYYKILQLPELPKEENKE